MSCLRSPCLQSFGQSTTLSFARMPCRSSSRDGGKTWTPLHENGANGIPPHLAHLADGRVLLTYAKRDGKTGGVEQRHFGHEWYLPACAGDKIDLPTTAM